MTTLLDWQELIIVEVQVSAQWRPIEHFEPHTARLTRLRVRVVETRFRQKPRRQGNGSPEKKFYPYATSVGEVRVVLT